MYYKHCGQSPCPGDGAPPPPPAAPAPLFTIYNLRSNVTGTTLIGKAKQNRKFNEFYFIIHSAEQREMKEVSVFTDFKTRRVF